MDSLVELLLMAMSPSGTNLKLELNGSTLWKSSMIHISIVKLELDLTGPMVYLKTRRPYTNSMAAGITHVLFASHRKDITMPSLEWKGMTAASQGHQETP